MSATTFTGNDLKIFISSNGSHGRKPNSGSGGSGGGKPPNKGPRCYGCGAYGHIQRNCPKGMRVKKIKNEDENESFATRIAARLRQMTQDEFQAFMTEAQAIRAQDETEAAAAAADPSAADTPPREIKEEDSPR